MKKLQDLVRRVLQQNYDLRDAVARVEEARASLGITRSNQYPNFGAGASVEINRLSRDGSKPIPRDLLSSQNRNFGSAALQLPSFEIDIWGRLRRATEAARANLLSAEENRKAVVTTLVSDVATSYLRQIGGVSTLLDLRQADQLVYTAAETIPTIQQQIELVADLVMPLMNGRELVEKLKMARPEMKVLFTFGYAEETMVSRGIVANDLAYLPKPFNPEKLTAKVRESRANPEERPPEPLGAGA